MNKAGAGRLHKCGRNNKRVCRRRNKSCRHFRGNGRQLFEDEVNVGVSGGTTRQVCLGFDSVTVSRTLRKFAFVLEDYPGDDYVILQVLADPWQILDDIN